MNKHLGSQVQKSNVCCWRGGRVLSKLGSHLRLGLALPSLGRREKCPGEEEVEDDIVVVMTVWLCPFHVKPCMHSTSPSNGIGWGVGWESVSCLLKVTTCFAHRNILLSLKFIFHSCLGNFNSPIRYPSQSPPTCNVTLHHKALNPHTTINNGVYRQPTCLSVPTASYFGEIPSPEIIWRLLYISNAGKLVTSLIGGVFITPPINDGVCISVHHDAVI